jgi:hypothetical protein
MQATIIPEVNFLKGNWAQVVLLGLCGEKVLELELCSLAKVVSGTSLNRTFLSDSACAVDEFGWYKFVCRSSFLAFFFS